MNFETLCSYPVIDVRSNNEFTELHIVDSANFPACEIQNRLHELPIRSKALSLFGNSSQLVEARILLEQKSYQIAHQMHANTRCLAELKKSRWSDSGNYSRRLWQPSKVVDKFIKRFANQSPNNLGLDIACGSGRDSVFMATCGWSMTGIDYSPSSLEKMQCLAQSNHQQVSLRLLDLEKNFSELLALKQTYGAVVVVRYLHRPALKQIKKLIDSQGFIIYQTFMKGCEKFGSPKNPRFLLEAGELATVFSDFDILLDEVEYLDDGRPTNIFIAQKV